MTTMIKWVDPRTIKTADFNPQHRTDPSQLKDLHRSMEKDGFHEFQPLLIAQEGVLGDGHRRLAVALKIGLKRVPVIETEMPLTELYALNVSHMVHKPRDWTEAYYRGLQNVPDRIAKLIQQVENCVGRDGVRLLVEYGLSPDIWQQAVRMSNYCGNPTEEFRGKVLYWLVEHKQTTVIKMAIRNKTAPEVLARCVAENTPLIPVAASDLPARMSVSRRKTK